MKLLVFDGNSIINRAFYGIKLLSTKGGLYTNGLYGFINIFNKQMEEEKPDCVAVAFDLCAPTFRHKAFSEYKAHRKGMPEELAAQMPLLKEWLDLNGIKRIEIEGFEADDILGTLAECAEKENESCVIVTGDRDALQLCSPRVSVKLAKTNESIMYTPERFAEEYGFPPVQLVDYKAICGDASDNIPGVAGIGAKGASDLVKRFGELEKIYDEIDGEEIKKSLADKLIAGKEAAFVSKMLAKIVRNAPVDCEFSALSPHEKNIDGLLDFYKKTEFSKFAAALREAGAGEGAGTVAKIEMPEVNELSSAFEVAFLDGDFYIIYKDEGLFLSCGGKTYFTEDAEVIKAVFESGAKKTVHDSKEAYSRLKKLGITAENIAFDTDIAAYLLDPTATEYSVAQLAVKYLAKDIENAGAAEVFILPELAKELEEKLEKEGAGKLFADIELPLAAVLADMEAAGIGIDKELLKGFSEELAEEIAGLETKIYEAAGEEFNIGSPKQLGAVLFEKLALPVVKKNKTGYATDAEVLAKISKYHPIIGMILDYRTAAKLKSTYADGLLKTIAEDGRIHTTFRQNVTATGRLSSTEPNLQNIPVRGEKGREIRRLFVPEKGFVFIDADYSQIELRVLAGLAGDKNMISAFLEERDIHTETAMNVFGVSEKEVTPELRRRAKAVNFGIVYGISDFSLAEDIGVSRKEAKEYIENYFAYYSGIKNYLDKTVKDAKENGFVTTAFGRRRYLPELKSSNFNIRSFGERVAMNTPIQGAAADIIKIAMINAHKALSGTGARLILQVHDELIVEAPKSEAEKIAKILRREMENAADLSVPLVAEAGIGENWLAAKG